MRKYYHGREKSGPYFEGWYLKHRARSGHSLALIPALHIDRAGRRSASLQIVADGQSWWLEYPGSEFRARERTFEIGLGQNVFSRKGVELHLEQDGLSLHGSLRYGLFTPLRSDIMGPFRFLSGMECSHGVISMEHPLEGTLSLNRETLDFSGGTGYIETDRGRSFPGAYLWTQCTWREPPRGSLMLSVAAIPLPVGSFTGCICAVICQGREYRLASYLGARVQRWDSGGAEIRQGKYRLMAELLEGKTCPLLAPVEGSMSRSIRESLLAKMRYRFWCGEKLLFEHTDACAGFEYADEQSCQSACSTQERCHGSPGTYSG